MIDILLTTPAFAVFESEHDVHGAHRYHDRITHGYDAPTESCATILDPTPLAATPRLLNSTTAVWVTPDGHARQETSVRGTGNSGVTIVTPSETIVAVGARSWPVQRYPRQQDPLSRDFEEIFGRPYPNEALALLNPFLMMREYVCVRNSARRSMHLDLIVIISLFERRPDIPREEGDDVDRLGSMEVEIILAEDRPILLGWDAVNGDERFERTRMTRLELDVTMDHASLFTPESALRRIHRGL